MRHLASRRSGFVAFVLVAAVLATPALLFAHAHLVRSTPAANATFSAPPSTLSFWFSEKPELSFTSIKLADSAGHAVMLGSPSAIADMGISVPLAGALANGKYTVTWRTAASDGHPSSGSFTFTVKLEPVAAPASPPAAPPPMAVQQPKPVSNAPIGLSETVTFSSAMRWAELVALVTIIGIVMFRLAVLPGAKWKADLVTDVNDRAVRLARAVLVLFAVATLTRGFAQAELMPATDGSRLTSLMMLVEQSRWGFAWAIGVAGVVVVLLGLLAAGRATTGWIIAAVGLVAMCLSEALTGHAGAVHHYAAAIAADVSHVLGAGGWLGGLVALLLCGLPSMKRLDDAGHADAGSRLLKAYHGAATECVTIVVLSAILAMWTRFPTASAIWTTPYGNMLLRKTFFVLVVLGFGLYHWRRVVSVPWSTDTRRRFVRSAIAELVFGAVVIAFTALLITEPLP